VQKPVRPLGASIRLELAQEKVRAEQVVVQEVQHGFERWVYARVRDLGAQGGRVRRVRALVELERRERWERAREERVHEGGPRGCGHRGSVLREIARCPRMSTPGPPIGADVEVKERAGSVLTPVRVLLFFLFRF
jgi:hypothetical protein